MGVQKVFSYTLANETGVTSDQVRKDFSEFNIRGNKRGGYDINDLLEIMEEIIHRNKDNNIILVGMGNLGMALSKYSKFVQRNMNIVATFDIDPFKLKVRTGIPVYSMSRVKEITDRFKVKVAILAVPEISAQEVVNELIRHGLFGEVDNRTDGVTVIVQGDLKTVDSFSNDILLNAPPASQIKSIEINPSQFDLGENFKIAVVSTT